MLGVPSAPEGTSLRQLYVRADASRAMGTGHVMRTLAIADAMVLRGFAATFLMHPAPGDLRSLVVARGHAVVPLGNVNETTPALVLRDGRRAAWLLVDHYGLDGEWERRVRRMASRVCAIDDLADRTHTADILIDANLDATPQKYAGLVASRTALLLGPRFAAISSEFAAARATIGPVAHRVGMIVVSMGGSDPKNVTSLAVAAALAAVPDAQVHVIAGPSFTGEWGDLNPRVHVHRAPASMVPHLLRADLAIGAAGTSALERACIGVPSLMLRVADNQAEVAATLEGLGIARDLGWATELDQATLARAVAALAADPKARQAMRDAGTRSVDGLGLARIANILDGIRLRRARWSDRMHLFAWANEPIARGFSSSAAPITLDEHLGWLTRNLSDPRVDLLIAENGLGPVGVLRLEARSNGELEVSINTAAEHRGGIGTLMLRAALARWSRCHPGRTLVARIKPGNRASEIAFERVGFRRVGEAGETIVYARPADGQRPPGQGSAKWAER